MNYFNQLSGHTFDQTKQKLRQYINCKIHIVHVYGAYYFVRIKYNIFITLSNKIHAEKNKLL